MGYNNDGIWKVDEKVFIFNLNQNKQYKNIRKKYSIYCYKNCGPYTDYFGIEKNSMKKLYHNAENIFYTMRMEKIFFLVKEK